MDTQRLDNVNRIIRELHWAKDALGAGDGKEGRRRTTCGMFWQSSLGKSFFTTGRAVPSLLWLIEWRKISCEIQLL
jgi:hypothetical protein